MYLTQRHTHAPSGANDGFFAKTVRPMRSDSDFGRLRDHHDAETSWQCCRSSGASVR